jgi:transposase
VLAAAGRLQRGRRLGPTPCSAAGEAALEGQAGLVPGGDRLLARPRGPQGPKSGPSPVDRARPGSKHHFIVDGQGIPLAVSLTGGIRNDVTQLLPVLDKIPAVAGRVGRPRPRPDALLADRGYDHDKYRRLLWQRGIRPVIAERGQPHGTGLGIFRYVVERTIAWFHGFRRLRIRGNDAMTSTGEECSCLTALVNGIVRGSAPDGVARARVPGAKRRGNTYNRSSTSGVLGAYFRPDS